MYTRGFSKAGTAAKIAEFSFLERAPKALSYEGNNRWRGKQLYR
jgi:hypothetical protein